MLRDPEIAGVSRGSDATNFGMSPKSGVSLASNIGGNVEGRGGQRKIASPVIGAATATPIASNGEGFGSHEECVAQLANASEATPIGCKAEGCDGQSYAGAHYARVVTATPIGRKTEGESGQLSVENQTMSAALATTIDTIREQWRRRQAWHRAEKSLTLQAKALCRRLAVDGDKKEADTIYSAAMGKGSHPMAEIALAVIFPLTEARDGIERHRKLVEKRLAKLAKTLPVAPWVDQTRGFGIPSLAAVVGEAGNLGDYPNPAKLWKRMGLAVMDDGTRQRRIAGAEAIAHGYNPARRSVVWNIGACIVKAGGPLKAVYDARKLYEANRVASKAHAHNRAQRYVEKRVLRDLWLAWRRSVSDETPINQPVENHEC